MTAGHCGPRFRVRSGREFARCYVCESRVHQARRQWSSLQLWCRVNPTEPSSSLRVGVANWSYPH
jgi:hypothetical protein